jgi:2-polyprenyl-6-methoxyphenol hydroxylase-like FAD-dependent oxidoreductase
MIYDLALISIDFSTVVDLITNAPPSAAPLESVRVARELGNDFHDEAAFYSITSTEPVFKLSAAPGSNAGFLRANRTRLRQWLATDIPVAWCKRYVMHTIETDGKVTAHFDDGTSASGDILVGADGAMSHVRSCLNLEGPEILPVGMIGGELMLNEEQSADQQALGHSFYSVSEKDCNLFVGLRDIALGGASSHYWLFQWRDEVAMAQGNEYWTMKAGKEERLEFVKKMLTERNVHTRLRKIIDLQPVDGILDSIIYRARIPTPCPEGPVTLIGDSMHVMPPFRGQGANNAISDAMLLGSLILQAIQSQPQALFRASDVIRAYEVEMVPRAMGWVLASRGAVDNFDARSSHILRTPVKDP